MKVKGTETTSRRVEIDVDIIDAAKLVANALLSSYGADKGEELSLSCFVSCNTDHVGAIAYDVEHSAGSHSYTTEVVAVAQPTKEQLDALDLAKLFVSRVRDGVSRSNGALK